MADEPKATAPPSHIMIDLETLGNGNTAAVWSIGAVAFSLEPVPAFEPRNFYLVVDPQSCQDLGLQIDASTVLWWSKAENNEAREMLLSDAVDLPTALDGFAQWLSLEENLQGVWGNASTFDNVILRNAYKAARMKCPWGFRLDRCFRTMRNMFPIPWDRGDGVIHNALVDAQNQARHLQRIFGVVRELMKE